MGVTSGAGTAYPSGAPDFIPFLSGFVCSVFSFLCYILLTIVCLFVLFILVIVCTSVIYHFWFVLFILVIVLSVLLWFITSDLSCLFWSLSVPLWFTTSDLSCLFWSLYCLYLCDLPLLINPPFVSSNFSWCNLECCRSIKHRLRHIFVLLRWCYLFSLLLN